jgi:drug/metabolite transporter (DMT)-like permease
MEEVWLLMSLGALVLYGISQVAQKVALNDIPASVVVFLSITVGVPISVVCLLPFFWTGEIWDVGLVPFALGILAATFGQIGYFLYIEAAQRGPISVVGSVTSAYPIMVVAVAVVFLDEMPGIVQLAGALLVTSSVIILSYIHGGKSKELHPAGQYFTLCVIAVFMYGLWGVLTKLALEDLPWLLFVGMYAFVTPPAVYIYNRYKGVRLRHAIPSWSVAFMIAIMATEIGNIGFFFEVDAVSEGPASIVFPLVASSPVIVILLAYGFLKERLTRLETALVLAVVVGIILVSTV